MNNQQTITEQFFALLVGKWQGTGRGFFPPITSFDYRETLRVEQRDETSLFYDQRTEKRADGESKFVMSHWESGFLRLLENGRIEVANVQSGGRGERLVGEVSRANGQLVLTLTSEQLTNDARMITTARQFMLTDDTLSYTQQMHTTAVDQRLPHLEANLTRTS